VGEAPPLKSTVGADDGGSLAFSREDEASGPGRQRRVMLQIAEQCCQKLFGHYGFSLRAPYPNELADGSALLYYSVIAFSGTGLRGSLVLGSSNEPLVGTNPAKHVPVRDWIAELANQLCGRIKNQLLLYALEIRVDTPVTLRDGHMSEARTRGLPAITLKGSTIGVVRVWLDIQIGRGFQMASEPDPSRAGPQESQTVIL
jgi:hypothetical protein